MATTTTDIIADRNLAEEVFRLKIAEEVFRLQKADRESNKKHTENGVEAEAERPGAGRAPDGRRSEAEELRQADGGNSVEAIEDFALAPLVDRLAYGLAKVLVVAVQEKCQQLAAATELLQASDARQEAGLAALRSETKTFSTMISERVDLLFKELGVQQEDIAAIKSTLCGFSSRADAFVERLDKQADVLRSMCSTYSQRETELEQLVDGLARLRAYPAPAPSNGL